MNSCVGRWPRPTEPELEPLLERPEALKALPLKRYVAEMLQGRPLRPTKTASCELLVLHNAGSLGRLAYCHELSASESRAALELNLTGYVALTQELLRRFGARRMVVVNVSSLLALQVMPCWSLYATAKAARDAYMRALAADAERCGMEASGGSMEKAS